MKSVGEGRIQQAFADVGAQHGGEFYLPASAADRYIDACIQVSLVIVGIEVFRVEGRGKLKPDLNQIADLSSMLSGDKDWPSIVRATAAEAHRFVEQVPWEEDVRLNFALLSEEDS